MNRMPVTALRAHAELMLWRHGWAWPLALVLLGAAGALYVGTVRPLAAEAARVERALASPALPVTAIAEVPIDERKQLQDVQVVLSKMTDATAQIRQLGALAQAEGIGLAQAEYHQQLHKTTGLLQVQVVQPVRATYPQLRQYIEAVLRAHPNVSLDQISARRDNVGQSQLEARLRWSFWHHKPEADAPTIARNKP